MAQDSLADEMADVGKGLEESLGCAVAAIFYIGATALFLSTPFILLKIII